MFKYLILYKAEQISAKNEAIASAKEFLQPVKNIYWPGFPVCFLLKKKIIHFDVIAL